MFYRECYEITLQRTIRIFFLISFAVLKIMDNFTPENYGFIYQRQPVKEILRNYLVWVLLVNEKSLSLLSRTSLTVWRYY